MKNFSESARLLHISQPALHAKVRKLSEQLDAKLYLRVGSALQLTSAGEQVARHARELLLLNQRFVKGLAQGQEQAVVSLAAGVPLATFAKHLGDAVAGAPAATSDDSAASELARSRDAELLMAPALPTRCRAGWRAAPMPIRRKPHNMFL